MASHGEVVKDSTHHQFRMGCFLRLVTSECQVVLLLLSQPVSHKLTKLVFLIRVVSLRLTHKFQVAHS